jgi:hypothetical protein
MPSCPGCEPVAGNSHCVDRVRLAVAQELVEQPAMTAPDNDGNSDRCRHRDAQGDRKP